MNTQERRRLDRMFNPGGVAVFGAVHETGKFGHMVIQSLIKYGYKGHIYPIYPGGGKVLGLKVYESLQKVDGPVDLARVCVPAEKVPEVLRDCLRHGAAGAEIISSGFGETGEVKGQNLQEEVIEVSRAGLRVLGPNCFGAHCPKGGITLLPGFDFSKKSGPVALISQSGGVATDFGNEARMSGLGLSKVLSFGNGCDLDATALLDYLEGDPDTAFIGAYLEGIKDGRKFVEILKGLTPEKPVVVWKGGLTPPGKRMAMSHTGSLGGDARIWKGIMAQTNAVAVEGLDEMVDTMKALVHLPQCGPRIALMGGGGAIGVFSSDLADRWGLNLPVFGIETQQKLRKWFNTPGNSLANPLDTGSPVIPLDAMTAIMKEILTREKIDVLVVILLLKSLGVTLPTFLEMDGIPAPRLDQYLDGLLDASVRIKEATGKEVVMVMENRANLPTNMEVEGTYREIQLRYHARAVPIYPSVERALRAIRNASKARSRSLGR